MKTIKILTILILCSILLLFCYSTYCVITEPLPSYILPPAEQNEAPTTSLPQKPNIHGKYSCLMDANCGRILLGTNENAKVPMASTTKIMTAILILENCNLQKEITVSRYATTMPKVHLGAKEGDSFYIKDLLYSLMLESHNDSAVILAEGMAGSVKNFANKMNAKAKELKLSHTHFVTPNGLDNPKHYSSASDLCRLALYAIKNKTFLQIIQTKSYQFQSQKTHRTYTLSNKDSFLSYYDGAIGVKTGYTSKAGYCFVGAAKKKNRTLITATLASGWPPNKNFKWEDTKQLMDYGFTNYAIRDLPLYPMFSVNIPVEQGKTSIVHCQCVSPGNVLIGNHETLKIKYNLPQKLIAPIRSNIAIGSVSYYINGKLFKNIEIFPSESIEKSDFSDTIRDILQKMTALVCH